MPFKIGCPNCPRKYTLADEMRGKAIRCKDCNHAFKIPGDSPQPAALQSAGSSRPVASQPTGAQPATRKPAPAARPAAAQPQANQLRSDNDVFTGSAPNPQFDPLANHVVHNPGFAYVDPNKYAPKETEFAEDKNTLYYNPAVSELVAKVETEKQIHEQLVRNQTWWPVFVLMGIVVMTLIPAFLMLFIMPAISIFFMILALVAIGAAGGVAEIWILTLIHRYQPENFTRAFFIAYYRYAFVFQNWDRHKDVGTLYLISIVGGLFGGLLIFLFSIMVA